MSKNNNKNNHTETDGLADLLSAFDSYGDEFDDVLKEEIVTDDTKDSEFAIELPELPIELQNTVSGDSVITEEAKNGISDDVDINNNIKVKETTDLSSISSIKKKDKKNDKDKKAYKKSPDKKNKAQTNKKDDKSKNEAKKIKKISGGDNKNEYAYDKAKSLFPIRLVSVLTVICAAVALLLASVNHFTDAKIAENTEKAMLSSIQNIFDESVLAESVNLREDTELSSAYIVIKNGGVCGYAASVAPAGFGGPLSLMIGVDSAGTVVGVEIVSMSETPGLGSRVGGEEFLAQFEGNSGDVTVDAISGATISSKAVMSGVNSVTSNLLDLNTLAAERSMTVVPYSNEVNLTETTAPLTEVPDVESEMQATEEPAVVPEVPETPAPEETKEFQSPPDVSKGDSPPEVIVENPGNESPGIQAEYEQDTEEYETLTTEHETSDVPESSYDGAESSAND